MDQEMRERFTRIETQMEALMELLPKQTEKLDTVLQLQVTIAGMQEATRTHSERLSFIFSETRAIAERHDDLQQRVNAAINWGRGVLAVIVLLIPAGGWMLAKQYEQLMAIDRRLLGVEYKMPQPPVPEGK